MKIVKRIFAGFVAIVLCFAVWWGWVTREREFSGIYVSSFESSAFYEGAISGGPDSIKDIKPGWLLNRDSASIPSEYFEGFDPDCGNRYRFELSFTGQWFPGPAGHLSAFEGEYQVTEYTSIKPLIEQCDPTEAYFGP